MTDVELSPEGKVTCLKMSGWRRGNLPPVVIATRWRTLFGAVDAIEDAEEVFARLVGREGVSSVSPQLESDSSEVSLRLMISESGGITRFFFTCIPPVESFLGVGSPSEMTITLAAVAPAVDAPLGECSAGADFLDLFFVFLGRCDVLGLLAKRCQTEYDMLP